MDNLITLLSCPIRLPLLVLVRTAFGMISRSLDNKKATQLWVGYILMHYNLKGKYLLNYDTLFCTSINICR